MHGQRSGVCRAEQRSLGNSEVHSFLRIQLTSSQWNHARVLAMGWRGVETEPHTMERKKNGVNSKPISSVYNILYADIAAVDQQICTDEESNSSVLILRRGADTTVRVLCGLFVIGIHLVQNAIKLLRAFCGAFTAADIAGGLWCHSRR